eukprot:1690434-Rhodomonas_salina.1
MSSSAEEKLTARSKQKNRVQGKERETGRDWSGLEESDGVGAVSRWWRAPMRALSRGPRPCGSTSNTRRSTTGSAP